MQLNLKDKKVLVMGLGLQGGGIATVRFLVRHEAKVTVTDLKPARVLAPALAQLKDLKGVQYCLGRHDEKDIQSADIIVKNPDLPAHSPWLRLAKKYRVPVITDLGIFLRANPATLIGVTGTRGKSTTSFLLWKFLKTKYRRVHLGGNIPQKSVLDLLGRVKKGDIVVLELSSFQLRDAAYEKISPHIALFTNILRDHLNKHKNMREYIGAKSFIFKFQKRDDLLFANGDDAVVRAAAKNAPGRVVYPKLSPKLALIVAERLGDHFVSSVGLAVAAARHLRIPEKNIERVLTNFHGLPERQEVIATARGVKFIDDTTATTPDAAIAALERFGRDKKKKLILIAGGQDKKLKFEGLVRAIRKYADSVVFLPGKATDKIKAKVHGVETRSMKEAVQRAWRLAKPGDIVLLSPGATSFGLFLNEFDRGEKFAAEVKKLKK